MSATSPTTSQRDGKVFINYRREDASGYAGRLYEWLVERFGPDRVFMDVSAIKPGVDFVETIETEIAACEAVLVIIGRQWLDCAVGGRRRLDDPGDLVRLEVASALSRNILVIPVLVEGAAVPREQDLPENLKPLARRNALAVSDERWEYDVGRLIDTLEERLEKRPGTREVTRLSGRGRAASRVDVGRYWRLFPVRLAAGLLALCAALVPQIYLGLRPEPVDLKDTGKFSPVEVKLGREELLVEGPSTNSEEGLLLSHVARADELVDVGFERARLDGDTLMLLSDDNPPPNANRIDYQTVKQAGRAGGEPCRTFIDVRAADAPSPPSLLRLYQLGAPGGDIYRGLEVKATDMDLLVSINTVVPDDGDGSAPGCRKLLKVGADFKYPTAGTYGVGVVAEADSATRFSFNPATSKNSLWGGGDGLFQPFDLGVEKRDPRAPAPLRARAVEVRALGREPADPTPALSARALDGGELLDIEGLKVGSDLIQVNVSGRGMVKVAGKDYVDVLGRVRRQPLATALLAALDAALIVWFMRLLFSPRQPSIR